MYNKRKLQACMKLNGDNTGTLAKALDVAISTMSYKINGKIRFSVDDIEKIALRYRLEDVDIVDIFLPNVATKRGNI